MGTSEAVELVHLYAKRVREEYPEARVVLFGSYADGTQNESSDIDVAVVLNKLEGDWLDSSAQLWRFTQGISSLIEPVLLDAEQDKSGFVQHVLKTGTVL